MVGLCWFSVCERDDHEADSESQYLNFTQFQLSFN